MNLLFSNCKYALLSNTKSTYLLNILDFTVVGELQISASKGSLQYETGIAALASESTVIIYDFLFKKEIYKLDTYQQICRVSLAKNILIVISSSRILMHCLKERANQSYIPIHNGELAIIHPDYYHLQILYYVESMMLCNRSIWLNTITSIEGVKFQHAVYSQDGDTICLALENMISFYSNAQFIKAYGYDQKIDKLISTNNNYFVIRLHNGTIIACNPTQQLLFKQFQSMPFVLDTVEDFQIFEGENCIYELGNQLINKYLWNKAETIVSTDTKNSKKVIKQI